MPDFAREQYYKRLMEQFIRESRGAARRAEAGGGIEEEEEETQAELEEAWEVSEAPPQRISAPSDARHDGGVTVGEDGRHEMRNVPDAVAKRVGKALERSPPISPLSSP